MKMASENRLCWVIAMLICLCLLSPAVSNADIVPIDQMSYTGTGLSETLGVQIGSYTVPGIIAGFYNLNLTVSLDPIWTGSYAGLGFCSEDQPISVGIYTNYYLYDVIAPFTNAAWLMTQYRGVADTAHEAASLQVAIWESVLDPAAFNLNSGSFYVLSTSSWDKTLANSYLASIPVDLSNFDTTAFRLVSDDGYQSGGRQDFMVYNASAVPIPPTVLLLGAGVLGMIGLRRKFGK